MNTDPVPRGWPLIDATSMDITMFDITITVGDKVRLYQENGWFFTGKVTILDDDYATVDFTDWIQQYGRREFGEMYVLHQRVLYPKTVGVILVDYRQQ